MLCTNLLIFILLIFIFYYHRKNNKKLNNKKSISSLRNKKLAKNVRCSKWCTRKLVGYLHSLKFPVSDFKVSSLFRQWFIHTSLFRHWFIHSFIHSSFIHSFIHSFLGDPFVLISWYTPWESYAVKGFTISSIFLPILEYLFIPFIFNHIH